MRKKLTIIGCILVLFLELGVLIFTGTGFSKEKFYVDIPYTDFIGTTIPDDRGGWYIDSEFPQTESGIFNYTPGIALKKGTYNITLLYETDTNENTCTTLCTTKGYHGLKTDKVILNPKEHSTTFMVYLNEDVDDFRLETYFGGTGYMIIKGCSISETNAALGIKMIYLFLLFIVIDMVAFFYVKFRKKNISHDKLVFGVILGSIALLSSYPLFTGYLMKSFDMGFHLLRIDGIKAGILTGQFPVKVQPIWMQGYGYPTSVFYGDLFLYIPAIMRLIGFSVMFSYNTLLFLCNIATVGIAYWSFHKLTENKWIGVFGALLYTIAPYRLTDLYIRHALGETLAITFFPLLLYGFYATFTKEETDDEYKRLWVPMVIGFTGIIQSHMLSCVMSAFFIIVICLFNIKRIFRKNTFVVLAKTVIYTSVLNAWFILPCLLAMRTEPIDVMQGYRLGNRIQGQGTHISQLFSLFYRGWGDSFDASAGIIGEMPYGIGIGLFVCLVLFVIALVWSNKEQSEKQEKLRGKSFFVLAILALYMSTIYFPWDYLSATLGQFAKIIANIQFATRFLAFAILFVVASACMAIVFFLKNIDRKYILVTSVSCAVLAVITCMNIMDQRIMNHIPTRIYDITQMGRTDYNVKEYMYYGTDSNLLIGEKVSTVENVVVEDYSKDALTIHMTIENNSNFSDYVEVPLLYYSWYRAIDLNGTELQLTTGENNVVRMVVPAGYCGEVTITFVEPVIWRIAEICSMLSVVCFIVYAILQKKKASGNGIMRKLWLK